MASMRDIKRRKGSIQSTGQITKAMKLVSTVKLQKARGRAEEAKPYFNHLYQTMTSIMDKSTSDVREKYTVGNPNAKKAVILISSNRGLAGGYNSNIVKLITNDERFTPENTWIYAVGRKGRDTLARKGYTIKSDLCEVMNQPLYSDASDIGKAVMEEFEAGNVGEIYIAFTIFRNTVSHIPTLLKLMPTEDLPDDPNAALTQMNYEPDPEEALKLIMPKYISGEIYGALIEALASENGARMQAMDNATSNAEEMLDSLTLQYNRARQSAITQEITEIIGGANALNE